MPTLEDYGPFLDRIEGRGKKFNAFRKEYKKRKRLYETVLSEIEKEISSIKKKHEKDAKLRIAYISGRIKKEYSIIRKAYNKDISINIIFDEIKDIIGIRIVVNNLRDIKKLIKELELIRNIELGKPRKHSDKAGYKAIHIIAIYSLNCNGRKREIPFEIQIRTLLQDVWAILVHHDVYKNEASLPNLAKSITKHLSQALSSLDLMADDFRKEIEAKVKSPNDLSDIAPMDKQGIAFLYYDLFGIKPQDYEVQYLSNVTDDYGIETIKQARIGLNSKVFSVLRRRHKKRFFIDASNVDLFEYGLLYSISGSKAYKEYSKKVERDWDEIETTARGEILSSMPETFDEFVKMIENDNLPEAALEELGGIKSCYLCGEGILIPYDAAEAVLDYYGNPDTDVELVSLFEELGGEYAHLVESVDFHGACQYCGYQMSKDD